MRRRDLILGAGLAVPAALLARADAALAALPAPTVRTSALGVNALLSKATGQFDDGRLYDLVQGIPGLLAAAHDLCEQSPDDEHNNSLLARCYALAAEALHKAGRPHAARITADRAVTYARDSADLEAAALSAKALAVVLRHEGRPGSAAAVMRTAADRLVGSGLRTADSANALAQVLCTAAYSAAQAGDRDQATAMIAEARMVSRRIPAGTAGLPRFSVTPAQTALYEVGIWWSLGEPGHALRAASGLHTGQFATPERRARLLTDMARVWDQAGQPDRAIVALFYASRHAASEVRDRQSMRVLAAGLVSSPPRAAGAQYLSRVLEEQQETSAARQSRLWRPELFSA